ncbi:hypothetical protein HPB50_027960 [Hyalomma asiaticum]|nr:hypothetical protein HPB50_027960 [Hyalomma asiaticum]
MVTVRQNKVFLSLDLGFPSLLMHVDNEKGGQGRSKARGSPSRGTLPGDFACCFRVRAARSARGWVSAPRLPDSSCQDQRYQSFALPARSSPTMDPSTGAIPKRPRKRKVKAKISFGSTTSSCNSSLPCHVQASLRDIITLLETAQKGEREEQQPDLTFKATEEAKCGRRPTAATTIGKNCDDSARCSIPGVENSKPATSTVEHHQRSVGESIGVARTHKSEPKSLSERDVMDIVKTMRRMLLKEGPLQEHELAAAVSPTHTKLLLEMHETMTAFLKRQPGFMVVHEDLYTFVYYEEPDGEVEDGSTSRVKDEEFTGPSSSVSTNSGRQDAAASNGGPERECATISS